ncbi:MAG: LicD family protein [Tissierella sp.]|uniref:LicD family protein n=1 Tax=Tissierella sp. TaxID=41274 RepID=UPI003F96940C
MDNILKKIHEIQLEIALEVKRLCEKNNINYILIAGTLLGAIRHKGFIPWDDDIDIGMLRADYERFLNIAKEELNCKYYLQTWHTDDKFGLPIAKIQKKGTVFIEQNSQNVTQKKGIFIDIFPFDNVPESKLLKRCHNLKTYILKRILISKLGYEVWEKNDNKKRIIYKIIKCISKPFSIELIKKNLEKEMKRYNNKRTKDVVAIGGSYGYIKEIKKRKWLDEFEKVIFEKNAFFAPKDYDGYLKSLYGDYMILPPKDKRENRHKIIKIDLGENKK